MTRAAPIQKLVSIFREGRHGYDNLGSFAWTIAQGVHVAAVRLDDAAHERKANPETAVRVSPRSRILNEEIDNYLKQISRAALLLS